MYKEASKIGLLVPTTKGNLTVTQLWQLTLPELDNLAVSLEAVCENTKSKSFLDKRKKEDKTSKLMFDIVLDILQTKVEEKDAATDARETKEHNQKILALIKEKQDEAFRGKTVEELEAMLKK